MNAICTDVDGHEHGVCICLCGGEESEDSAASDVAFVAWLGVPAVLTDDRTDPSQGRGLGRALLAEGLRQMAACGYAHVVISTAAANLKAQLVRSNECPILHITRPFVCPRSACHCQCPALTFT